MNIIERNFLRLIRSGAFNEYESIEPMSLFKWKKLLAITQRQKAMGIAANGIRHNQYASGIPDEIKSNVLNSYNGKSLSFDFSQSHLSNGFLNRRLEKIRNEELNSPDTSVETIDMLNILVCNTFHILTNGVSYGLLVYIGKYLRLKRGMIDFGKLDKWLKRLHIRRMAQFEGSILIETLNFKEEEIPFAGKTSLIALKRARKSLSYDESNDNLIDLELSQGEGGFISYNNKALGHNLRHCIKYFSLSPIEASCNFFDSISNSLAKLEE